MFVYRRVTIGFPLDKAGFPPISPARMASGMVNSITPETATTLCPGPTGLEGSGSENGWGCGKGVGGPHQVKMMNS